VKIKEKKRKTKSQLTPRLEGIKAHTSPWKVSLAIMNQKTLNASFGRLNLLHVALKHDERTYLLVRATRMPINFVLIICIFIKILNYPIDYMIIMIKKKTKQINKQNKSTNKPCRQGGEILILKVINFIMLNE